MEHYRKLPDLYTIFVDGVGSLDIGGKVEPLPRVERGALHALDRGAERLEPLADFEGSSPTLSEIPAWLHLLHRTLHERLNLCF
jgi:hypothetical protein